MTPALFSVTYIGSGIQLRKPDRATRLFNTVIDRVSSTTFGNPRPCPANTCSMCSNGAVPRGDTHGLIVEAMQETGLPAGTVNFVTNAPADAARSVDALVAHPKVRRVNFTGSTRVGRLIAEQYARHLRPAVLELGGKAPFIVLGDADVDAAVGCLPCSPARDCR